MPFQIDLLYQHRGERGGSEVERWTPEREDEGSKPTSTLLPESTGNTQEAVVPSRHDRAIADRDVKPHHIKTKLYQHDGAKSF